MKLQQFVDEFIDGYIASDLETMSDSARATGMKYGDVGYPMVSTTLAGIELLGGLLLPSASRFTTKNGMSRFLLFWDNYLVKDFPVYKGFGKLFYNLLRSGIAHTYTAKHGVYVTKGSATPLRFDDTNRRVYIDSNVFAQDFLTAYRNNVTPLVSMVDPTTDPNAISMQTHLDEMISLFEVSSDGEFRALAPSKESIENGKLSAAMTHFSAIEGASGPPGDMTTKPWPTISGMPTPNQ